MILAVACIAIKPAHVSNEVKRETRHIVFDAVEEGIMSSYWITRECECLYSRS